MKHVKLVPLAGCSLEIEPMKDIRAIRKRNAKEEDDRMEAVDQDAEMIHPRKVLKKK